MKNTCAGDALAEKKLFIFDMDGTIYIDKTPLPYAVEFIDKLAASGRKVLYFTNNASKSAETYREKLRGLGFHAGEKSVLTSGDVLIEYLCKYRRGKNVYLLGTADLHAAFKSAGIALFTPDPRSANVQGSGERPEIVVTSFDTTLTYFKAERACTYIREGSEWLTTHPDINCPAEGGFVPDCGAINAMIAASTGNKLPRAFGKPSSGAAEMITGICGVSGSESIIFGDRLYTDIAFGKNNRITAAFMLTGEGTESDANLLPPEMRPDYTFADMSEPLKLLFEKGIP